MALWKKIGCMISEVKERRGPNYWQSLSVAIATRFFFVGSMGHGSACMNDCSDNLTDR